MVKQTNSEMARFSLSDLDLYLCTGLYTIANADLTLKSWQYQICPIEINLQMALVIYPSRTGDLFEFASEEHPATTHVHYHYQREPHQLTRLEILNME